MEILHSKILGQGKPLLILHGFLGMGDNWKTLGNRFANSNLDDDQKNFQVHLIDQRNHGRSFHSATFNYEVLVEDLRNYMEHHALDKASVIGHSMGGKTAMLFAINYPEKVDKLIIGDIGPKFYPNHHESILLGLNTINFSKQKSRGAIEEVLSSYIKEPSVRQFLLKNVYRITKDTFSFRFNLKSLTTNYDEVGVALGSQAIYTGESLFLRGENSGYISQSDESLIHFHFPNSKILTVKRAGHWLHAENPSDFYDYVYQFLTS